jgi:galacturonosyltransferase
VIKDVHPDIILSFTIKPNIYTGIMSKIRKIPVIMTITGLGSGIEDKTPLRMILLRIYRWIQHSRSAIVYQNKDIAHLFDNNKVRPQYKRLVAGSGVNITRFRYQEYHKNEQVKILYISRIMKSKGIEELATLVFFLAKQHKDVHVDIVGSMEESYEGLIKELLETGIVSYHGRLDDVRSLLQSSDVLVHPTYYEGMSNVLLEASATGRPVLASNIPGCKEIVEDRVTGLLFEPRSADSLIQAVNRFLDLPIKQREQMGRKAREKVEREFNRDEIVTIYLGLISEMTNQELFTKKEK